MPEGESKNVIRVLHSLELLAAGPRTEDELAGELDAHPRTIHRLMEQMEAEGYVSRNGDGTKKIEATLLLVTLAGLILERTDIVQVARPFLARLHTLTGEASHLCVPRKGYCVHVAHEFGERATENRVVVRTSLGERIPYHATAHGKALLAFMPSQLETVLGSRLEEFTEYTITDSADLLQDLAEIRRRGFGVDNREHSLEVRCAAAPVFSAASVEAIGAIGVSAPAARWSLEDAREVGAIVARVARELSEALGFDRRRSLDIGQASPKP